MLTHDEYTQKIEMNTFLLGEASAAKCSDFLPGGLPI